MNQRLNKSELYKLISQKTKLQKKEIINVFKAAEDIIFDYLSDVNESENKKIYIMTGLCMESKIKYQNERVIPNGNIYPKERIFLTAKVSKRYKKKINQNR